MVQTQSFKILPNGKIKGGTLTYSADLVTGAITWSAVIQAGWLFFTKTINQSGVTRIDPADFNSSNANAVGKVMQIDVLHLSVLSIQNNVATVSVVIQGQSITGNARLDISQPTASIIEVVASGNVSGFQITLDAVTA